jgi:hypothetical protein|tara:strand:- start:180 stop:482 length:303 start_codon:yes stop_codon:yes gene_type:complete
MINENGNFFALLYVSLLSVVVFGLYSSEPSTTGFAVLESDFSEFDVDVADNGQSTCIDGSLYQECSSIIQGKFCQAGKLVDYCELCGCYAGEECSDRKCS